MNIKGYTYLGLIQILLFWFAVTMLCAFIYAISSPGKILLGPLFILIAVILASLAGWIGLKKLRRPYKAQFAMTKEQKSQLREAAGKAFLNSGSKD